MLVSHVEPSDGVAFIDKHSSKSQLRFLTCGSVDDGKSTLIGRLLYDAQLLTADQIERLHNESRNDATTGTQIDFARLLDGLSAEREQGITIDVAYRFFSTAERSFVVADCPGHEQYTRNMVTGAANCELAVILVDARKGILSQTRRHTMIVAKLGLKKLVLAINKMDLVDWEKARFDAIEAEFSQFVQGLNAKDMDVTALPLSGLLGDNVTKKSTHMSWYAGPTLLQHLENVTLAEDVSDQQALRIVVQGAVQNELEPDLVKQRWITGFVASGVAQVGSAVRIMPSGRTTHIAQIAMPSDAPIGVTPTKAITLALEDETDCARGDLICAQNAAPSMADCFLIDMVWMQDEPLVVGNRYWLKIGSRIASATVLAIQHRLDVATGALVEASSLELNEIGQVVIEASKPICFESFETNPILGSLILIDVQSNATCGAGMIVRATNLVSENLHWQFSEIDAAARASQKGQTPLVVWLTGLSGAGKSTIANLVEKQLFSLGHHTYLLEGDNLRFGLNRDLGFSSDDRRENIRRAGEVARLMFDGGLIVIAAFITPFAGDRAAVRHMMPTGSFIEVHVDVTLAEAERRDPKGLYSKARAGLIKGFTGIDSPYERVEHPEIYIDTQTQSAASAADTIVAMIKALQRK